MINLNLTTISQPLPQLFHITISTSFSAPSPVSFYVGSSHWVYLHPICWNLGFTPKLLDRTQLELSTAILNLTVKLKKMWYGAMGRNWSNFDLLVTLTSNMWFVPVWIWFEVGPRHKKFCCWEVTFSVRFRMGAIRHLSKNSISSSTSLMLYHVWLTSHSIFLLLPIRRQKFSFKIRIQIGFVAHSLLLLTYLIHLKSFKINWEE